MNLFKTSGTKFLPSMRHVASDGFSYMVTVPDAKNFIIDCLIAVGTSEEHARTVAEVLIFADQRGLYSRGLHRLDLILTSIQKEVCNPQIMPQVIKETSSTVWVNGMNGLGPVVSKFCTEKMIAKAKDNIVAVVTAKNSHYNGCLDYYVDQGMQQGLFVICCGNTPLSMCPKRSKRPVIGSNPICMGAVGENDDMFVFNLTSTMTTYGQIVLNAKRNLPLPLNWAKDILGRVTTNPEDALEANLLLPLSNNKGLGLGIFSEVLSSILSNADFGQRLVPFRHYATQRSNIGHCFIAVDVEKFASNFKTRLSELLKGIRKAELVNPRKTLMMPGDVEKYHMDQVARYGGIIYYPAQIDASRHTAKQVKVKPLRYTKRYLS